MAPARRVVRLPRCFGGCQDHAEQNANLSRPNVNLTGRLTLSVHQISYGIQPNHSISHCNRQIDVLGFAFARWPDLSTNNCHASSPTPPLCTKSTASLLS